MLRRFRSAVTGRYVNKDAAASAPDTTVSERTYHRNIDGWRTDDGKVWVNEGHANVVEYVRKDGKKWGDLA